MTSECNTNTTVENDRIRVTVPRSVAEHYLEGGKSLARTTNRSPETEMRALILSDAMSKIGNQAEAALLRSELGGRSYRDEIETQAQRILIAEYLTEHTRYTENETLRRGTIGARMSEGMADEWAKACAYANGCLHKIDINVFCSRAEKVFDAELPPNVERRQFHKLKLEAGFGVDLDAGEGALAEAALRVKESAEWEVNWREQRGVFGQWQIDVVGDLPAQIGLCRVRSD